MKVTFTRTGEKRYRVSVDGPGITPSWAEPAPGYDARLPHDMAHFIVENELNIAAGIFGQLAAGGHAKTFHPETDKKLRKLKLRGDRMAAAGRDDCILSEKVVALAWQRWNNRDVSGTDKDISNAELHRVCRKFDAASSEWSGLAVGESMMLIWNGAGRQSRRC